LEAGTRLQTYAVWDMVVFILNGLAFILIELQLPGIIADLAAPGGHWPLSELIMDALRISSLRCEFSGYFPPLTSRAR
jgi:NhaP-type Na+/H+ or K+/H+ antiporter